MYFRTLASNLFTNINDDEEPYQSDGSANSETHTENNNTNYDNVINSLIDISSPERREFPPEDYRFIDKDTYLITNPEKWYGYTKGTKIGNHWYWQKTDNTWVDENGQNVGLVPGILRGNKTRLSTKSSNKNIAQFMTRLQSSLFNTLLTFPGIGPLLKDGIQKQLEEVRIGELPAIDKKIDFVPIQPGIPHLLQQNSSSFLNPYTPLRESIRTKKMLNTIENKNPELYKSLFTAVPRPVRVYTENDLSESQLQAIDKLVINSFKRHHGYFPDIYLGDILSFPIEPIDYKDVSDNVYGKNSGFFGTLERALDPLGSVETSIGAANIKVNKDGYTLEDKYDFNAHQANYKDSKTYGNLSMWARRGGLNSKGHAETDLDPDVFKQRFFIRRKFK